MVAIFLMGTPNLGGDAEASKETSIQISIRCFGEIINEITHYYIQPNDTVVHCLVDTKDFEDLDDDLINEDQD